MCTASAFVILVTYHQHVLQRRYYEGGKNILFWEERLEDFALQELDLRHEGSPPVRSHGPSKKTTTGEEQRTETVDTSTENGRQSQQVLRRRVDDAKVSGAGSPIASEDGKQRTHEQEGPRSREEEEGLRPLENLAMVQNGVADLRYGLKEVKNGERRLQDGRKTSLGKEGRVEGVNAQVVGVLRQGVGHSTAATTGPEQQQRKTEQLKLVAGSEAIKRKESTVAEGEKEVVWTNMETLGSVLRRIAVNNTVIIVTVNTGFRELFLNWLVSVHRLGLSDRVLVFAGDVASWRFLEKYWPGHAVLFQYPGTPKGTLPETDDQQWFGLEGYGRIVNTRPAQMLACLEHGYNVLYSDIDAVFLSNPLPHVTGNADGSFAWDGWLRPPWFNGSDEIPPPPMNLDFCSCFLFFRPTQQSIEVMQRWMLNLRRSKEHKNQPALNDVFSSIRADNDTCFKFRILPTKFFPSGHTMLDPAKLRQWKSLGGQAAVVHLNFYFSTRVKIEGFKSHNLWFLNSYNPSTSPWPQELSSLTTVTM
ncbi:GT77-family glycosyltransferase [Chara braunii]|uniref:GT77-family glycosyltransferase n=1 Tax=Chara braunii TaxID=69332 RepID=A0A388LMX4_CHABU|nr:GT77-family glycosyltransferase [Chara braunii]|eukprot:GBG83690.1 GT77-family glycosyltransferase [Chara braunii]